MTLQRRLRHLQHILRVIADATRTIHSSNEALQILVEDMEAEDIAEGVRKSSSTSMKAVKDPRVTDDLLPEEPESQKGTRSMPAYTPTEPAPALVRTSMNAIDADRYALFLQRAVERSKTKEEKRRMISTIDSSEATGLITAALAQELRHALGC